MLLVSTLIWTAAAAVASDVLTVDVTAGGLGRAAIILTGRHGVAVNYEGVPRVVEGVSFRREINGDGVLAPLPISHTLRFEYPANATPREAAEAAVTAWNATPQREAHYRVLESDGMLHFTPFEVLTVAGTYEPYVSLLDAELVLDRTVGTRPRSCGRISSRSSPRPPGRRCATATPTCCSAARTSPGITPCRSDRSSST